jgi:hypothetical protein
LQNPSQTNKDNLKPVEHPEKTDGVYEKINMLEGNSNNESVRDRGINNSKRAMNLKITW